MELIALINKLINFDNMLLIDTLKKDSLDKEKAKLIRKHLDFLYKKENEVRNNLLTSHYIDELFAELSEEIKICITIASARGLSVKDL